MASGVALAKQFEATSLTPAGGNVRIEAYGGLVGQMIDELDARMGPQARRAEVIESPEDFLHGVSVVCGYVGLLAGFGAVAAVLVSVAH